MGWILFSQPFGPAYFNPYDFASQMMRRSIQFTGKGNVDVSIDLVQSEWQALSPKIRPRSDGDAAVVVEIGCITVAARRCCMREAKPPLGWR